MDQSDSENMQSKNKEVESTMPPETEHSDAAAGDEGSSTQSNNPDTSTPTTEFTSPSQTPKRADTRSRFTSVLPFSALDELKRIRRENRRLKNQNTALEDYESCLREKEITNQQQLELDKEKLAKKEAELDIREKGLEFLLSKQQAPQDHNLKQLENLRSWHDNLVAKEMELSTLKDNLREDIDQIEERKRRKEESELPDISTAADEELRSSRDKQGQDEPRDVVSIGGNAGKNSHRATSLYDKWSETGSTFLEKYKYKGLPGNPGYQTLPQAPVTHGLPLVEAQLPENLRQLTGDKIENFLHHYRNIVRNVPSLSIRSLLTKDLSDLLEQRGVNIDSSEAIINYLTRHLINFEKAKRLRCLGILEKNLKCPSAYLIPAEQIYLFFDQVSKILKHLDKNELKKYKKKILWSVINQIPSVFGIEYQQFLLVSKGFSVSKLKSILLSRRFLLER
eukprot:snap_masked-scaffold_28-processed-gene-4.16-mRNA-1 protein AED:1.00 eAED:1.00 QI:0/-1/0/0/-1/1/1/0/451